MRYFLLEINHYKQVLTDTISQQIKAQVSVDNMQARLYWFVPELLLNNVNIKSFDSKPILNIKQIHLGFNWAQLMARKDWLAALQIRLIGADFSMQKVNGNWQIVGLNSTDNKQPDWLLNGKYYQLLDSHITWLTETQKIHSTLNCAIYNSNNEHQAKVVLSFEKQQAINLIAKLNGNNFEAMNGLIYVETKQLSAQTINTFLPQNNLAFQVTKGHINSQLWLTIQNSQINTATTQLQLQQAQINYHEQLLNIKQLQSELYASFESDNWQLSANKFLVKLNDTTSLESYFNVSAKANNVQEMALYIEQANLQEISAITQLLSPQLKASIWLKQAQLQGTLKQVSAFIKPFNDELAIKGDFLNISFIPTALLPLGLNKLSGSVQGNQNIGKIDMNLQNSQLNAPDLYTNALSIKQLKSKLLWQNQADNVLINSEQFNLELQGLKTQSRLKLIIPKIAEKSPFLDLQMAMTSDDVSQLKFNFPNKVMHPDDVSWLSRSLVSGQIKQGGLLYYGYLNDYPFKNKSGVFEVQLEVEKGRLQYAPDWPIIDDISAQVLILNDKLEVNATHGHSGDLEITQATVINPQLGKSKTLSIDGKLNGEINAVLDFLKQTPLHERINALSHAITAKSKTDIALNIVLPLINDDSLLKVNGIAQLKQAQLIINDIDLLVSQINGQLKFNEQGIYSDIIQAQTLAQPVQVNIENSLQQTQINVLGKVDIKQLQEQFPLPWWQVAKGLTHYQLSLKLPRSIEPPQLQINSQLKGITVQLPDNLAKTALQEKALQANFSLNGSNNLPITLSYDGQLKAQLMLNVSSQNVESGQVLIGEGQLSNNNEIKGLTVRINRDNLALHEWLAGSSGADKDSSLSSITIHSNNARWQTNALGAFDLNLEKQTTHWLGNIKSRFASGQLKIPLDYHDKQGIQLNMESIDLAALTQLKVESNHLTNMISPDTVPLLQVNSQQTLWRQLNLGRLSFATERDILGIKLHHFNLTGELVTMDLTGDWQKFTELHATTQLNGHIQSNHAGQLLKQLNISKDLSESKAMFDFSLNWQNAPQRINLATMQGHAEFNLQDGRILSVEPGLGRILGILAVAQWTKRLQLDFSDLYQQGLKFDNIDGHLNIHNGIASNQLTIDAIPAKITLKGDINLVNRTLTQLINVAPKSADAVPIAGTLLGKISSVFSKTLTGKNYDELFFGSQYRALGTWKDIQIIPLPENDGLLQKTWTGISSFPWLGNTKKDK